MTQTEGPALEAFSAVVESVYDAALEPSQWPRALAQIAALTNSARTAAGITDHVHKRVVDLGAHGFDVSDLAAYKERFAVMNPLLIAGHLRPVGSVYTMSMLVDEAEFLESRLYSEWARPLGLRDFIGVHALRSGQRSAGISAIRKEDQPRYGERDVRLFQLLSPHICRAFAISDALELRTVTSELLQSTLDALATGVYLVDRHGHVVYLNPAAERQVRSGTTLRVRDNRLVATHPGSQALLHREVESALHDHPQSVTAGHALAIQSGESEGLIATVLPLHGGRRGGVSGPFAAAAAIFAQDPQRVPPLPGEAFAKVHGLTAGELRVLLAMAPGLSVKEAAQMLGISETTSKTHLQRIFSKTGTSKQSELIRLLMSSAPPIRSH